MSWTLCWIRMGAATALLASANGQVSPRGSSMVLDHPCPEVGAGLGFSTAVLQMDGKGEKDVAAGAPGQGAVVVFHGRFGSYEPFELTRIYTSTGAAVCPVPERDDGFGFHMASGQLDSDPLEELVVSAPWADVDGQVDAGLIYVMGGVTGMTPFPLPNPDPQQGALFGNSVAVGNFNGDTVADIAVGVPGYQVGGVTMGAVFVFFGPWWSPTIQLVPNPRPVENGFFGGHVNANDSDGDGIDELFVTAIGNTAAGIPVAGQAFVFPGPLDPNISIVVEDPVPSAADLPSPRFGMHMHARGKWLLIGGNRKDWNGVHDAGVGFAARAPLYAPVDLYSYPNPRKSDHFAYRCLIADVVGDSRMDLTFILMGWAQLKNPNPRALVTWDGANPTGPPTQIRTMLPGSSDHFANGLSYGQLFPGGREEFVVGDARYGRKGPALVDVGRVVIYMN